MPLVKHGHGEILPEPGDEKKTAKANWSEADERALVDENTTADAPEEDQ